MHDLAIATDAPLVAKAAVVDAFAHLAAAKDDRLDKQQSGTTGHVDCHRAIIIAIVEQDGFLRQPGKARPVFDFQLDVGSGNVAVRFVNSLASLCGDHRFCVFPCGKMPFEPVAACHAAGSVYHHCFQA